MFMQKKGVLVEHELRANGISLKWNYLWLAGKVTLSKFIFFILTFWQSESQRSLNNNENSY